MAHYNDDEEISGIKILSWFDCNGVIFIRVSSGFSLVAYSLKPDNHLRVRLFDEFLRVNGLVVFTNFIMTVRTGRTPGAANIADLVTTFHSLTWFDRDF